jgi:hypothetical protein
VAVCAAPSCSAVFDERTGYLGDRINTRRLYCRHTCSVDALNARRRAASRAAGALRRWRRDHAELLDAHAREAAGELVPLPEMPPLPAIPPPPTQEGTNAP